MQQYSDYSQSPKLKIETTQIDRFNPTYWRVDGPQTMSFAITNYLNGFEVVFRSRTTTDLAGIVWDSHDAKDHKFLAYETKYDYSGMIWDFDLELSASMPALNNEALTPTLTVHYREQGQDKIAYIVLFNYADQPASRTAHIQINWDTVKAGFSATDDFPVTHILRISFSAFTMSYNGHSTLALPQAEDGYIRIINSVTTGVNARLALTRVIVAQHQHGICTSYDDHYDLNPQRLVDNIEALGYQGLMNHYCGMSKYPEMKWRSDLNTWQIPDTLVSNENVVNPCALAFHADTGLYAPDVGTIYEAMHKTGTPYDEFKAWLRNKLGQTCQDLRTVIKAKHPNAKVSPLIFFPTIRTPIETLVTDINYPSHHYAYPNFDYITTESYDWILEAKLGLAHEVISEIPTQDLNYPEDKVAYLAGFVPDTSIAHLYGFDRTKPYQTPIWQRIFGDMENNDVLGLLKQFIWAYPQIMSDSITIDIEQAPEGFFIQQEYHLPVNDDTPYPPEIYL